MDNFKLMKKVKHLIWRVNQHKTTLKNKNYQ